MTYIGSISKDTIIDPGFSNIVTAESSLNNETTIKYGLIILVDAPKNKNIVLKNIYVGIKLNNECNQ